MSRKQDIKEAVLKILNLLVVDQREKKRLSQILQAIPDAHIGLFADRTWIYSITLILIQEYPIKRQEVMDIGTKLGIDRPSDDAIRRCILRLKEVLRQSKNVPRGLRNSVTYPLHREHSELEEQVICLLKRQGFTHISKEFTIIRDGRKKRVADVAAKKGPEVLFVECIVPFDDCKIDLYTSELPPNKLSGFSNLRAVGVKGWFTRNPRQRHIA